MLSVKILLFVRCNLLKMKKIYFVGVVNDKVINVVLDASGESEQWSVSETPGVCDLWQNNS